MLDRSKLSEHYRQLADDELARIALSGNLVPEAKEALAIELSSRGLTDLSEYKRALDEAASYPEREMQYLEQANQKFASAMLVAIAWLLAGTLPFTLAWVNHPTRSAAIKFYSTTTLLIGLSCYQGIRARRRGSRRGFVLRLMVPLSLLAISTVVVLSLKALNLLF